MNVKKKREFIIHVLYWGILALAALATVKYLLPLLSPFVAGFVVAWLLKTPIAFLSDRVRLKRRAAAALAVLLFYCTIGLLLSLLSIRAFASLRTLIGDLPDIYTRYAAPAVIAFFDGIEKTVSLMDASLLDAFEEMKGNFIQSAGQLVSNLSLQAMARLSGLASSLPGLFLKLLLMVISTFFIAMDYRRLTGFCLNQLSGKAREVFLQIKSYVVDTLFVCIRSYGLIMSITFLELSVGLTVIGVDGSILIALCISLFDILPVLGTGGIMIPWTVLTAIQGDYPLAFGLLAVYLFVTVIRNILESKIVGSQIGLHPVVTLASMFAGLQLFGILGLFGFPILLSLLCRLNETGVIHIFRTEAQAGPK